MQRNHIIVLGSLGVLAGLAWYQRKSAGAQAASVTALGQKSNDNIAASILGSLAPMPSQYSTKAQTASVVDSKPTPAPAPAASVPFVSAGPGAAPRKLSAQEINENVNRIGVADDAAVFKLADWGRQNNVSIGDFSAATGYLQNDVANVFAKRGILYGF